MKSIMNLLKDLFGNPSGIEPDVISGSRDISNDELMILKRFGLTQQAMQRHVAESVQIDFERNNIYKEIDRGLAHWMMGSCIDLYADASTTYSTIHNSTVWVTGSKKYETVLNKLFEDIGLEEKILDWAWNTGGYGDMFIRPDGIPGVGITSVDDSFHPSHISRIDYNGVLLGFFRTPYSNGSLSSEVTDLIAPWAFVHFRLLGAKKRRPLYEDPTFTEYRTVSLMGPDAKQISTKYGTSLLLNGLPIYKRLRLAEDALLMARLTRGIQKYIYKIKVDSKGPVDAAVNIVDMYRDILKRARAVNLDPSSPNFDSKYNTMGVCEDLFVPVFGDVGDIAIDKIGGEADIRWIADIEELRNQLACALRCPLALLGGFTSESTGALGSSSIEKQDIRFARNCRRLQRGLINGITRLCQIHLAYLGMDPDPTLFEVQMSETSTAEELELKDNLDTSVDVVQKTIELFADASPNLDKVKLLSYLNDRILKLGDVDINSFFSGNPDENTPEMIGERIKESKQEVVKRVTKCTDSDMYSYLPISEKVVSKYKNANDWEKVFEGTEKKVKVTLDSKVKKEK